MTSRWNLYILPLLILLVVLTAVYVVSDDGEAATITVDTDWVVDTVEDVKSDNTYVMKANLTVTATGQISFRRCKFSFMSESPGDYGITVQPGGYLTLHTCQLQAGYLTPSVLAEPWTFHVQDSGRLSLQSSTVLDLGVVGGEERKRGLAIESDNAMVSGNTFEECNRGLVILGAARPQVLDNTFKDNMAGIEVKGSSFELKQTNTFQENVAGLLLQEVNTAFVSAGEFVDNGDAIRAVSTNLKVENITVSGMGDGFVAEVNSRVVVENCSVQVLFDRGTAYFNSNLEFINCESLGWSGFTKTDVNSHLTVNMTVRFHLVYAGANYPVQGADVELRDMDESKVYQQVTGEDGMSPWRMITVFEHHGGLQPKVHQPYTALASLGFNYAEQEDISMGPNHVVEMTFTDDDPPDLTVQLPMEGSFHTSEEVEFKGRLNDLHSAVSSFHYSVDGGDNVSLPIQNNWQMMVVLPEGDLSIDFVAVDLLGNQVVVTRTVHVDLTAPVPADLDPAPGSVVRAYQLILNGTTEPGATLEVQGNDWEVGPDGRFSGYITLGDTEGEETVGLKLTDMAGNVGTYDYVIVIDRTPPTLEPETEPDHLVFPYVNESTVRVFGESEPGATVRVLINDELVEQVVADDQGMWSMEVELVLGENDLLVDAWDLAGNRNYFEIIDFWYDVTPPEITLLAPEDGLVVKNKVTFILVEVRSEPDAVVWVNDETEKTHPAHGELEFPEVDLPFEGNNTITVYARDRAGNLATMSIVVVRQEKKDDGTGETDGFPIWLVVLALAIVVVAAVVVQRFVRK